MSMYEPGGLLNPGWFRIPSGEHEGRLHVSGWMGTALESEGRLIAFAICPVCHVLVIADTDVHRNAYGDQTWAHEQWHARTDFPIPEDLQVTYGEGEHDDNTETQRR